MIDKIIGKYKSFIHERKKEVNTAGTIVDLGTNFLHAGPYTHLIDTVPVAGFIRYCGDPPTLHLKPKLSYIQKCARLL